MKIRLYDHPFSPAAPRIFETDSLARWLLEHYGEKPPVRVQIFRGEPSAETEISYDAQAILAGDCKEYVVLQSPGGLGALAWTYIIVAVVAVAAVVLTPKPTMPGNVNRDQESPNNALGSRENKLRMLERVEDIYGTVKAIPSLMMPTYLKYINHQKYEYGYYCVGRGYYDIVEIRDGDTLISEIDGASAAVYDPFTSPNSGDSPVQLIGSPIIDSIVTATRAVEVDGITLKALNQVQLIASDTYTFTPNTIRQASRKPNFNAVTVVGDQITVTLPSTTYTVAASTDHIVTVSSTDNSFTCDAPGIFSHLVLGDTVTVENCDAVGEFGPISNDGTYVVVTLVANGFTVAETLNDMTSDTATFAVERDYNGTYTVASVSDGVITVETSPFVGTISLLGTSIQLLGKTEYTDWVTLPHSDRTEVWCNVAALNGMFKDNGGKSTATVEYAIEIEKLDADLLPLGIVETVTSSLSGSVTDERADTIEHATAWIGPARVRMRRTTPYDYDWNGTVSDEIKWADVYSISPTTKTDFGNKATIHTVTQATARATAVKTRQLNCYASRKLPTYNGSTFSGAFDATGRHVSGTIAATSRIVDIIAAVSVDPKIGARDVSTDVDIAQIWGVQQLLDVWNTECGQFNYTFDTDNTSFEETVVAIANAAFCIAYRQNGKIRLALDREQTASSALFTHRNKKPKSETITRKFASDSEYDGVEFVYQDPDSNQSETIRLPLDGSYTKLKKFEIPGIRSFTQAWLRANREYYKLVGQRITIDTTLTRDARALLPNSRIDIVDNTRFKSYDGEVIAQNGLELTLSNDVAFTAGATHSIVLMKRDGSLESIACTAGADANKIILQALPAEAIVTTGGIDGIRTIYSLAADTAREAQAWLVQEIDLSDPQYVPVKAINYSPDYYQMDYAAIPARDAVIE